MARRRGSGIGLKAALVLLAVLAAALGTFAIPVSSWRTGEVETASRGVARSDAEVPTRLWIDTDAACGHGSRADPDDCLAVLGIARSDGIDIAGISTIFGNAELAVTDTGRRGSWSVGSPKPESPFQRLRAEPPRRSPPAAPKRRRPLLLPRRCGRGRSRSLPSGR